MQIPLSGVVPISGILLPGTASEPALSIVLSIAWYRISNPVVFIKILFIIFVKKIVMNIQAEKLELMRLILETDNPGILASIKKIFKTKSQTDFWETLPQDQKDDILQGIQEIEKGEVSDYEAFIKNHR